MVPHLPKCGVTSILFIKLRDGNYAIYVMDPDGSNLKNLTNNGAHDLYPVWPPDGTKIAFVSLRIGSGDIYVMNADGTKIAFVSNRDGNWEIYVMDADGATQTNLTNNAAKDTIVDCQ